MKKYRERMVVMVCLASVLSFAGRVSALDVSSQDESVKKVGVAWNIAQDRKIENDGGLYQPEGLDKYVKRLTEQLSVKIDQLSSKLDRLSTQNDRLEKKVDQLIAQGNKPKVS
ncbi:MAG TPA: hypothetical protein PLL75_06210 [Candidatus Omnitrophota bacterium]|nr:hypothetical protein [Candidatus Omnitrophota bacterium]HPS37303.1 hypothetical protein [Candidatus Omnitrophota bacterium]